MLDIHKIVVPTPYSVGPVNAYLVKNQPFTLIDPGPETAEAVDSLEEGLSSLGVAVTDIKRVLITHNHSDHSGLAARVAEKAKARVFVHKLEIRKLTPEYNYYQERFPFFAEGGLPESELKDILDDTDPVVKPVLPDSIIEAVDGGEELHFDGGSLRVLHLPGHTSGHICLYNPVDRELLAGDFLLKRITPNPVMEAEPLDFSRRTPALKQYLDSLDQIEEMDVRINLPGHGETIDDNREITAKARRHHARRLEAIQNIVEENSSTAYQVMRRLYPKIRGFQIFLGISEVFAHLDYLLETGRIAREERNGVSVYHR